MKENNAWPIVVARLLAAALLGALALAGAIGVHPVEALDACRRVAQAVLFGS